jgi:hypothetical protein
MGAFGKSRLRPEENPKRYTGDLLLTLCRHHHHQNQARESISYAVIGALIVNGDRGGQMRGGDGYFGVDQPDPVNVLKHLLTNCQNIFIGMFVAVSK